MAISPSDIRDVAGKGDDFGHEMRVGEVIRSIPAIRVKHGGTYIDPITSKPRQFDYRCSLQIDKQILVLPVECKNLPASAPLVVCGTQRREDEAFHDLIESGIGLTPKGATYVSGVCSLTRRATSGDSIYLPGEFVGKSLFRIKNEKGSLSSIGDSDIYDKWAQALSSAFELAKKAGDVATTHESIFTAILPSVVVPDETLWRVEYNADGVIASEPTKVDECALYVGRDIKIGWNEYPHRFAFSHIHFFTLSGFRSFLSKMAVNDLARNRLFTSKALEVSRVAKI